VCWTLWHMPMLLIGEVRLSAQEIALVGLA
jgi:hypothetical protein